MNKENLIKKELLRRKIKEYFSKHPKKKSVVIESSVGNLRTVWRVVKLDDNFNVTEVNTNREQFIISESGTIKEVSMEFSSLSRVFMDAMSDLKDHQKLSKAHREISSKIGTIADPIEKKEAGSMLGALTGAVDASTAGGGSKIQMRSQSAGIGPLTQGVSRLGKVLREDDNNLKKKDPSEEETSVDKLEPVQDDSDSVETTDPDPDLNPEIPTKTLSSEEIVINKALAGQTIRDAALELDANGGILTLHLVNSNIPAKIEWSKAGKVVFSINDRPYVLRRESDSE